MPGMPRAPLRAMQDRQAKLDAFEARTQRFSVGILKLLGDQVWSSTMSRVTQQLAASATSVSANLRAVRRARSTREFAAKLQIVNEEIDEATHWLEVLAATGTCRSPTDLDGLINEARQLRAMFAKARKTTRALL